MKRYTYECKMADGRIYRPIRRLSYHTALKYMTEDKAIFTGCTDWKVVLETRF